MNKIINICKLTANHFNSLLHNTNHKYIFVGVKGGGCNGLKYYIDTTSDKPEIYDELVVSNGIPIIVCGKSLIHLLGSEIKWKTDNMGSGIEINNPNAKSSCGGWRYIFNLTFFIF